MPSAFYAASSYYCSGVARGAMGAVAPPKIGFFFFFFLEGEKREKEREKGKCFPETFIRKRMKKEKEKGIGLCQYINYP